MYAGPHPQTCCCPNCGYEHYCQAQITATTVTVVLPSYFSDTVPSQQMFDLEKCRSMYEAERVSRGLARLPDLPKRRPRMHEPRHTSPLAVHVWRCSTRRPRLSLHARVLRSLACRRPSP